ncbi:hypothetical protein, partial [Pseudomonas aeruginosa]|uniref:hypothetical protein n=1 Tax=Pseudomonas aeruginosa TaxID=287 RepID=UPI001E421366
MMHLLQSSNRVALSFCNRQPSMGHCSSFAAEFYHFILFDLKLQVRVFAMHRCASAFRRRARGRRPAPHAESRPFGFDP